MQEDKNKAETILFTTGGFLALEDISKLTGIMDLAYLKEVVEGLQKAYAEKGGSLEIIQQGNQWKLSIKRDYMHLTEKLLKNSELDRPTQETLAVIAFKTPVFQSSVIKIRGNKAYDHIKMLRDLDFITADKSGRTRLLKLTEKFYSYFDVVPGELKKKFDDIRAVKGDFNIKDDDAGKSSEDFRQVHQDELEKNENKSIDEEDAKGSEAEEPEFIEELKEISTDIFSEESHNGNKK